MDVRLDPNPEMLVYSIHDAFQRLSDRLIDVCGSCGRPLELDSLRRGWAYRRHA
jgi:hypothetical protein